MGLQLEISLDKDIKAINGFFTDLKFKAVTISARQALNRAAMRTRSLTIKEIRKRRNVKLRDLKGGKGRKGFVTVRKAKGMNLATLEARVNFSSVPLPMILFILGTDTPKAQTLPNSERTSRHFEIVKGKKKAKAGLFIEKAKHGDRSFQVFRRGNPNDPSKGFKLQTVPSIAAMLIRKTSLLRKIENRALAIMQTEYDRALKFNLSKLKF